MRIAVGASSFSQTNSLECHNIVLNPYGRKMTEDEIIDHLANADGLLAGLEPLTERVFSNCPALRAVARIGIGMDNVDIDAAKRHGIKVSNTPDAPTYAVAEMTLAALLSIVRQIIPANNDIHNTVWKKRMGLSLMGSSILLIGYGRIGRKFEELIKPFHAQISVFDPLYANVLLDDVIQNADIISLHASGKEKILDAKRLNLVKPGVIILNSARGGLVDEAALIKVLDSGGYYWADTFVNEPYTGPLIKHPNAVLTPHISTYTTLCRRQMESQAVKNLLEDLSCV